MHAVSPETRFGNVGSTVHQSHAGCGESQPLHQPILRLEGGFGRLKVTQGGGIFGRRRWAIIQPALTPHKGRLLLEVVHREGRDWVYLVSPAPRWGLAPCAIGDGT